MRSNNGRKPLSNRGGMRGDFANRSRYGGSNVWAAGRGGGAAGYGLPNNVPADPRVGRGGGVCVSSGGGAGNSRWYGAGRGSGGFSGGAGSRGSGRGRGSGLAGGNSAPSNAYTGPQNRISNSIDAIDARVKQSATHADNMQKSRLIKPAVESAASDATGDAIHDATSNADPKTINDKVEQPATDANAEQPAAETTAEPASEVTAKAATDASGECHIQLHSPALTQTVHAIPMPPMPSLEDTMPAPVEPLPDLPSAWDCCPVEEDEEVAARTLRNLDATRRDIEKLIKKEQVGRDYANALEWYTDWDLRQLMEDLTRTQQIIKTLAGPDSACLKDVDSAIDGVSKVQVSRKRTLEKMRFLAKMEQLQIVQEQSQDSSGTARGRSGVVEGWGAELETEISNALAEAVDDLGGGSW